MARIDELKRELAQTPRRWLVTGGAGFIGSNLIPYLLRQAPKEEGVEIRKLVNFDKLTPAANLENLADSETDPRYQFIQGDVCDRGALAKALVQHEIQAVIHLAAETSAERSPEEAESVVATNLMGTFHLLEACRVYSRQAKKELRFIQVSSDDVYGPLEDGASAHGELAAFAPTTLFAATKAGSSLLVGAYSQTHGFPAIQVTGPNCFGPFQFPHHLIPLTIRRVTQDRTVALPGDGSHLRDWLYVEDFCRGLTLALLKGAAGEAYHVSAHHEHSNLAVAREVIARVHALQPGSRQPSAEELIRFAPERPAHDPRRALDGTKIRRELEWEPRETFESGLRKTVQWYLDNEDWNEAIEAKRRMSSRPGSVEPSHP